MPFVEKPSHLREGLRPALYQRRERLVLGAERAVELERPDFQPEIFDLLPEDGDRLDDASVLDEGHGSVSASSAVARNQA
jgi:hypothetical protein